MPPGAAEYVREAKRRNPSEPDELISTVADTIARDYFGTPSENKEDARSLRFE